MDALLLRQLGGDHALADDLGTGGATPGKSTLTSRLTPAPQVIFRVADPETARALGEAMSRGGPSARIQREVEGGRDGNGVAAGAEAAVDRAAGSAGTPLPTGLQRQFEGSLGADLSSVRVHTGAESQAAAHAVGAKAYTVGQDIHFGAGKYQPDDPFGMHLLAHEVAHTVQQSGGAQRRQHQLEVSAPHDAAEHEADRAADAMVQGAPAVVGSLSGLGRKVARDYRSDMDKAADASGDEARGANNDRVLSVSTIKDKTDAAKVHGMVTTYQAEMQEAVVSKDAAAYQVTTNNQALSKLQEFQGAAQAQDVGISNFKILYKNVQVGYARLNGMASTAGSSLTDKNAEKGVNAASGTDLAKDHIGNAARDNAGTSAVAARAQKLAAMPGNQDLAAKLKALQLAKDPLGPQVAEVVTAQSTATNAVQKITGAAASMRGLEASFQSAELKAAYTAAKAKVDETNKTVEETLGLLLDVTKSAATEGPAGVAKTLGEKLGPKIATMVAAAAGVPGLTLTPQDEAKDKQAEIAADNAKVEQYNAARIQLQTSAKEAGTTLTGFMNKVALLDQKKADHKKAMDELGASLDAAEARQGKKTKPGEMGTFQIITTFLGEADSFLADAKAAKEVGQGDLSRGTSGSAAQVAASKQSSAGQLLVYIPNPWIRQPSDGPKRFTVSQQWIKLDFGGKDSAADSSHDADDGTVSTISTACHAIEQFMIEIEAYKKELRAALGA